MEPIRIRSDALIAGNKYLFITFIQNKGTERIKTAYIRTGRNEILERIENGEIKTSPAIDTFDKVIFESGEGPSVLVPLESLCLDDFVVREIIVNDQMKKPKKESGNKQHWKRSFKNKLF